MAGMNSQAKGAFILDSWDTEEPFDDRDGTQRARVHLTKTFSGDLIGVSDADLITVGTTAGPAAYVAIERFEGTVAGKKGGFVLQHSAGGAGGVPWLVWKIVEGTGTGELSGIRGEGEIVRADDGSHTYVLDYEL
jgi:Protein of unknown function (DUF3224)